VQNLATPRTFAPQAGHRLERPHLRTRKALDTKTRAATAAMTAALPGQFGTL